MNTITVRQMPFEFPDEIDPVFMEGDPEGSFGMIAASLLLPHLEPYLIRTMKAAAKHVTDPKVMEGLRAFSAQEAQHYKMHAKFNEAIRTAGFPRLEELEKELSDDYHRFSNTKSLRWNLAYAEGFEALTMNVIKILMEPDGLDNPESAVMQMWEWHFVEELEHRTVAFDVFDHVVGGYWYRLAVGVYAQWHFTRWIRKVSRHMLEVSPPPKRTAEEKRKRARMRRQALGDFLRNHLGAYLRIYLPSYSPHRIEIAPQMQVLAEKYDAMATHTS